MALGWSINNPGGKFSFKLYKYMYTHRCICIICKFRQINYMITYDFFRHPYGYFTFLPPSFCLPPTFWYFLWYHVYLLFVSLLPHHLQTSFFAFLASAMTGYILTSEVVELGTTDEVERWHLPFWVWVISLNMIFSSPIYLYADFIFLYSWIEFCQLKDS